MKTHQRLWLPILLLVLVPALRAQGGEDVEVQTSGPVHEGFASPTVFDETDPYYVDVDPPAVLDETPPLERPQGGSEWVPGYWSYHDDRRDWIWVSGTWRVPPPQHVWISGYWIRYAHGWRYVPGYWAPYGYGTSEITYLPTPPATYETGPIGYAPWVNAIWIPGNWIWVGGGYMGWMWRPGYWVEAYADWVWIPASYVWTPYGYIYIEGHYDHSCEHRGLLFAPVCFSHNYYLTPGYVYTPGFAINISIFATGFFCRPSYCHYYFGDYYAPTCWNQGIYPAYSFHFSKYGCDPLYAHAAWRYGKGDPKWGEQQQTHFMYLREHQDQRPPRTLAEQNRRPAGSVRFAPGVESKGVVAAVAIKDVGSHATQLKVERIPDSERPKLTAQVQDMKRARAERVKVEGSNGPIPAKPSENPRTVKSAGFVPGALVAKAEKNVGTTEGIPKKPELPKARTPETDVKDDITERRNKKTRLRAPTTDVPAVHAGRPVDGTPVKKPDETPPTKKPDLTPPTKKPDLTPPVRKPVDTPPLKKPDETPPTKKPDLTPPVRKPVDTPPLKKPDETPPTKKPDVTPPVRKPVDTPPLKKPDETPPTKKPDVTPPVRKPVDTPPLKKPDETPPTKKPVDTPPVKDPRTLPPPPPKDPRTGTPPPPPPKDPRTLPPPPPKDPRTGTPPPPPPKDPRTLPPPKPKVLKPGEQPESQPVKKPGDRGGGN